MTKKEYKLIADAIQDAVLGRPHNGYHIEAKNWIVQAMATRLAANNPKFDEDKFIAACGTW